MNPLINVIVALLTVCLGFLLGFLMKRRNGMPARPADVFRSGTTFEVVYLANNPDTVKGRHIACVIYNEEYVLVDTSGYTTLEVGRVYEYRVCYDDYGVSDRIVGLSAAAV